MSRRTDVIIVGAGQAGLAMSRALTLRGTDHCVLERGRAGERWRSERWPGLTLLTPSWMNALPGMTPPGTADSFPSAAAFAAYLDRYRARMNVPLVTGCAVLSVTRAGRGFHVLTTAGDWLCRSVVIATGACDWTAVPPWAAALPRRIRQLTPAGYRGPTALPAGEVLVVGASATGVQLAAAIQASGRQVTLSVGRHVRAPRRYRGQDLFRWLDASGFLAEPRAPGSTGPVALPSLQLVGSTDNRDIDLARLAAAGVRIAGRALGSSGPRLHFAPTLGLDCAAAEDRRRRLLTVIDRHISTNGLTAPPEPAAWEPSLPDPASYAGPEIATASIRTVIWATGFRRRYPWLRVPALDAAGEILSDGGITPVPGLYTLGLPFMRHRSSAFIHGVGSDAEAIASVVSRHLDRNAARAA